jgi:hypothetical protein
MNNKKDHKKGKKKEQVILHTNIECAFYIKDFIEFFF